MSTSALTSAQIAMLDDPKWRRRNSKWRRVMWWTAGVYGWAILWFVASKLRSKKAVIVAGISTVLGVIFLALTGAQPQTTAAEQAALEGTTRAASPAENAMTAVILAMVAFNIWMTFYMQKDWLVWAATKKDDSSWVEDNLKIKTVSQATVTAERTRQAKVDSGSQLFGDASDLIADAPTPEVDSAVEEAVKVEAKEPEEEKSSTVDVNSASIGSLLKVPGITEEHAEKIIVERKSRGGFKSFDELRLTLELKPHEVAKLEGAFEFPASNSGPSFGRVLDV